MGTEPMESRCRQSPGTKENARELNAWLDTLQNKVYEAHRKLVDSGKELTVERVKNLVEGKKEKGRMFIEVFLEHNNRVTELVNKEFAPRTLESIPLR